LQIYIRDQHVAAILSQTGWDGNQATSAGQDYLLAVDTNLGFNKVSAAIDKAINYDVVLGNEGEAQATVTLIYTHTIASTGLPCEHGTEYYQGIQYQDLMNDCYWNYLRLYTPPGSTLLQATSHPLTADYLLSGVPWDGQGQVITDEPVSFSVFANFLFISQGQTASSSFTYALPPGIIQQQDGKNHYVLEVHKQAGAGPLALTITVTLPARTRLDRTIPAADVDGKTITFTTVLNTDQTFEVIYD
jgi:hypothetical protein